MKQQTLLQDREWKEFLLSEIFDIKAGKRLTKNDMKVGHIPFVGASDSNNGITMFISNINESKDSNVLGVNYNGSVCETFYHPYECVFSDDVKRLSLKNGEGNKYVYLFIKQCITQQKLKYQYGYKFNGTRMKKQIILLPVDKKGIPDYSYMESYMMRIEKRLLQEITSYYKGVYNTDNQVVVMGGRIEPLLKKEWKGFYIGDIFTLQVGRSKGLNHLKIVENGVSYLGATNRNNGVLEFVEPVRNLIQDGNAIAFIRNGEGSMGYSVYKKEPFIATSDITVGYNDKLNPYIGMFITTIADKVRGKYNFGYKRSDTRLKKETVQLPIDKGGNPDYQYMEQYMKLIKRRQIRVYLEYAKSRQEHDRRGV